VRLFYAVALPDDVHHALSRMQSDDPNYRWVDTAQAHLTLAFLGEQPETSLPELERIGAAAASASRHAALRLGEPGSFGPRNTPRVLWIGLAGDLAALTTLQRRLTDGLRTAEFPVEDRPFAPHITLARRRERAASRAPAPWPPTRVHPARIPLDALTLFQSKLSPRGATYLPLARFVLGAHTSGELRLTDNPPSQ
jgi:RNA 2',3'-cyclic 3'-phosphodiesterase